MRDVFAKLAMTEALLTESKERPTGRLKVTTTVGFGSHWLAPRVQSFLSAYPDVSMALLLDDSDLDLAMREADVAIRMHAPKQPDLVQRHLMSIRWHIVASHEYVRTHGAPTRVEELDDHALVLFGDYRPPVTDLNFLAEAGRRPGQPRRALLEVNSLHAMAVGDSRRGRHRRPAALDAGRGPGPDRIAARPEDPQGGGLFRLSGGTAELKRVAVFRDFLLAEIQALP